ncbi:hypothetical protein ACTHRH_24745 [Paenibacillus sp. SAFN-117]
MEPLGPNDILAYLNFNVFAWEQDYLGCPRSFYDKCCGKMGGGAPHSSKLKFISYNKDFLMFTVGWFNFIKKIIGACCEVELIKNLHRE